MTPIIVICSDHRADPVAIAALNRLRVWVQAGVMRPFWSVSNEDTRNASYFSAKETVHVDLLTSVAATGRPDLCRLLTVGTAALDPEAVPRLASAAHSLAGALRRFAPGGVPVIDARIIAPEDLLAESPLVGLCSTHAQANVALVPEDRSSDESFAVPVGLHDAEAFAAHVAAELATLGGLWIGMTEASVDHHRASVIDHGDAVISLARSQARLAAGPSLPVDEALSPGTRLPVPSGSEAAPDQRQAALSFADQLFDRARALHHQPTAPFDDHAERLTLKNACARVWREATSYVRHLPQHMRSGMRADFHHVTGEALNNALGQDSVLEVVWPGRSDQDPIAAPIVDVDALRAHLAQRVARGEPPTFDQQLWSGMVANTLAVADGGPTGDDVRPPVLGAQRLVVVEPNAIGPDPSSGPSAALATLSGHLDGDGEPTLLGRISERIRQQVTAARIDVDTALATIARDVHRLRHPRIGVAGFLSWILGCALAASFTTAMIGLGWAEDLGVADWTTARTIGGVALAVAVLAVAGVSLMAATRGTQRGSWIWITAGATLGSGLLTARSLQATGTTWPWLRMLTHQLANAVDVLTITVVLLVVIIGCRQLDTSAGRSGARLTGIALVAYLPIALIGLFVRKSGWYGDVIDNAMHHTSLRILKWLALVGIVTAVVVLVLRVRERLTIGRATRRLRHNVWAADSAVKSQVHLNEALRQFHGTALAISAIVWRPCGVATAAPAAQLDENALGDVPLKVSMFRYDFSERGRLGVVARIRRKVAEPGWLLRQYGAAVEAFRPEFAFQTGTDLGEIANRRPESDRSIEDPSVGTNHLGVGARWRFTTMLYEGQFDHDLRVAATRHAFGDVLEQYFQRADGVAKLDGDDDSNLSAFANGIVRGEAPRLDPNLFAHLALPTANDPRTAYSTKLAWPTLALEPPDGHDVAPIDVEFDGPHGLVLPFVRADWSSPFALGRLPIGTTTATYVAPPVEPHHAEPELVM